MESSEIMSMRRNLQLFGVEDFSGKFHAWEIFWNLRTSPSESRKIEFSDNPIETSVFDLCDACWDLRDKIKEKAGKELEFGGWEKEGDDLTIDDAEGRRVGHFVLRGVFVYSGAKSLHEAVVWGLTTDIGRNSLLEKRRDNRGIFKEIVQKFVRELLEIAGNAIKDPGREDWWFGEWTNKMREYHVYPFMTRESDLWMYFAQAWWQVATRESGKELQGKKFFF